MFTCGFERSNFSFDIFSSSIYKGSQPTGTLKALEPAMRFELMTSSLPRRRSTPELRGPESKASRKLGAGDEVRTRDPQLGRLMLYQLSYSRPNHCQLSIANFQLVGCSKPINRQLAIGNRQWPCRG